MRRQVALITGVNGFIGSNLARTLLQKGFTVHGIIRKTTVSKRLSDQPSLFLHKNDLSNPPSLKKLLKKINPNYIFHLATFEDYRDESKIDEMILTNIIGTKNLLLASIDTPYSCFINTGSSSEYGLKLTPMKETDILEPANSYAITKAAATHLANLIANQYKKPIITFRLFSVYGPGEAKNRFIPTAIISALKNESLSLTKGGINRDFIYVDDVVDAYLRATKVKVKAGTIYNIGTGKQFSNLEIVKTIEKVSKKKININKKEFPKRLWDTDFWVSDNSLAKKTLKWKPKYSLEEGIKKTYIYVRDNLEMYV